MGLSKSVIGAVKNRLVDIGVVLTRRKVVSERRVGKKSDWELMKTCCGRLGRVSAGCCI